jgi:hypothetical protein
MLGVAACASVALHPLRGVVVQPFGIRSESRLWACPYLLKLLVGIKASVSSVPRQTEWCWQQYFQ